MTTNLQEKFTTNFVKNFTKNRTATDNRYNTASNKNAGNAQQNARRELLFIRKSALFAIFFADSVTGSIILSKGDRECPNSF